MIWSRRRLFLVGLLAVSPTRAQDGEGPERLILDASRALQAGNAVRFMSYFDEQAFAEFGAVQRNVTALTATRTLASSVEILAPVEEEGGWRVQVDWLLQLTPLSGPGTIETRQEDVSVVVRRDAKERWRIASFDRVDLFRVL